MKIIAITDIHSKIESIHKLEKALKKCELILIAGDITDCGTKKDAETILNVISLYNKNILAVAGNMDTPDVAKYIEERGITLHGTGITINETGFFGAGGVNIHVENSTGSPENDIYILLKNGWEIIKGAKWKILLSHFPPASTKVDKTFLKTHVGSKSIRSFIEEYQPDLCVCGHIHESKGEDKIGKTSIINPGPVFKGGWGEINIHEGKIEIKLQQQEN